MAEQIVRIPSSIKVYQAEMRRVIASVEDDYKTQNRLF